jgi:NAD(P)-dependent dehydrogenase (short-subunit alcohol dehydrogenase family)
MMAAHGAIGVLFNNAGIAGVGKLHQTPLDLWERVIAVNVRGDADADGSLRHTDIRLRSRPPSTTA